MQQWHSNPQNVPKGMFSAVYGAVAVGKVSTSSSARSLRDILAPAYNKATSAIGREILPVEDWPEIEQLCILGFYSQRSIQLWTDNNHAQQRWQWLQVYTHASCPRGGEIRLMGINDSEGSLVHYNWLSYQHGQQSV